MGPVPADRFPLVPAAPHHPLGPGGPGHPLPAAPAPDAAAPPYAPRLPPSPVLGALVPPGEAYGPPRPPLDGEYGPARPDHTPQASPSLGQLLEALEKEQIEAFCMAHCPQETETARTLRETGTFEETLAHLSRFGDVDRIRRVSWGVCLCIPPLHPLLCSHPRRRLPPSAGTWRRSWQAGTDPGRRLWLPLSLSAPRRPPM